MLHKNSSIPLVCLTCELIVHRKENFRVGVNLIQGKITASQIQKHVQKKLKGIVSKREFTRHRENCTCMVYDSPQ